ncbi:hypothetical protein [Bartonella sp. AU18XJBT]|uniref:hypothetical protein n=1 Tax=Bartonella sp. AU18XJBT TaxID=3019089 RepID=UPI003857273A
MDLQATIGKETLVLAPGQRALIPTGLIFHLSLGFEARHPSTLWLSLKTRASHASTLQERLSVTIRK